MPCSQSAQYIIHEPRAHAQTQVDIWLFAPMENLAEIPAFSFLFFKSERKMAVITEPRQRFLATQQQAISYKNQGDECRHISNHSKYYDKP